MDRQTPDNSKDRAYAASRGNRSKSFLYLHLNGQSIVIFFSRRRSNNSCLHAFQMQSIISSADGPEIQTLSAQFNSDAVTVASAIFSNVLPRDAMRTRDLCCRSASVCPSVTFVYFIQMAEDIVKLLSQPIILVFWTLSADTQFQGELLHRRR